MEGIVQNSDYVAITGSVHVVMVIITVVDLTKHVI